MGIAGATGVALMQPILEMQFGAVTTPLGVMRSLPWSLIGGVAARRGEIPSRVCPVGS